MRGERAPWLRQPLAGGWVFTRRSWFLFFLREITCIFVGLFAVEILCHVRAVAEGPEAYARFLHWLSTPWVVGYHAVAFLFLLWHTVTWFVAAPKALRPRLRAKPVSPAAIIAGHYALWIAVSVVLFWLLT